MEKIIYSNILNETMFLRSSSLIGKNKFLCRVLNLRDLVNDVNIKSGLDIPLEIIPGRENEILCIEEIIDKLKFDLHSYEDVISFKNSLDEIRLEITSEDELSEYKNTFKDDYSLNENYLKLSSFYEAYLNRLKEESYTDEISLMHHYLDKGIIYDEIIILKEEDHPLLEKEFLHSIAKTVKEISYSELYEIELNKNEVNDITPYYGSLSEVDGVLEDVLKNGYKFSDVLFVLPSKSEYPSLFLEKYIKDKINFTFECGVRITSSNTYKLFKCLTNMVDKYSFGVDGFKALFSSGYFKIESIVDDKEKIDYLSEVLGRIKPGFEHAAIVAKKRIKELDENRHDFLYSFIKFIDKRINVEEILAFTYNVLDIFAKGIPYIIRNFANTSHNDPFLDAIEDRALSFIEEIFERSKYIENFDIYHSYVETLDQKFIYQKTFSDNAIHVSTLPKAINTLRKHVYFIGFDASSFPGTPRENYLFNDKQREILTGKKNYSKNKIIKNNDLLRELISIYSSLGSDVHLSYSAMNINEVNSNNPSSVLLEYDSKMNNLLKDKINECRYFSNKYSSLTEAVDNYLDNKHYESQYIAMFDEYEKEDLLKESYSPSALSMFFECPLRFYLEKIKYVSKEEPFDVYKVIGPNTFGNLLHLAFEHLIKRPNMSKIEFSLYADDIFESYLKFNLSMLSTLSIKKEFMDSINNGYEFLKKYDLSSSYSEYKIYKNDEISINDIFFNGSVDLLTKYKDGNFVIIDYKTGKKIKHDDKDTISVLQGLVYAKLVSKKLNVDISKVIFYYTSLDHEVTIDVHSHDEELEVLLKKFYDSLKENKFEVIEDEKLRKEACKYCPFKGSICKKGI